MLKLDLFNKFWNVFDQVRIILKRCCSNDSNITQSISNLSDELSKLVYIVSAILGCAQPLDVLEHLLRSLVWVHVLKLVLIFSVESLLLHEWVVDELIVEELIENIQLVDQEDVEGVDNCAHDSHTVSLDGIEHLLDANRLDLLRLSCCFYEYLRVQVVIVLGYELLKIPQ